MVILEINFLKDLATMSRLKEEVPTGEPEPVLKSSNLGNLGNPIDIERM